jgi:DNA (cytosine-5)-methyltransferase 1
MVVLEDETEYDLFAGPGGWSQACKALGLREVGVELDTAACMTRANAGHATICGDVAAMSPSAFKGKVRGLIASPPCQGFSDAGKRNGRNDLETCKSVLDDLAAGNDTRQVKAHLFADARSVLVVEPLRWALALWPEWIALEQVPAVLPIWEHMANHLRQAGYSVWTGVLNAADYGVPQTRRRAILIASRMHKVGEPQPTHARVPDQETLFGPGRAPWVSMAEALGWEHAPTVNTRGNHAGGGSDFSAKSPAWALTKTTRSWLLQMGNQKRATVRAADQPAPTLAFGHALKSVNFLDGNGAVGKQLTAAQASVLQTFPPDYPWAGSRTKQFEQIGNAVPPRLAEAILKEATHGSP